MNSAAVMFHSLTPLSCSLDCHEQHFLARVVFTLQIGGRTFADLAAHIKLTTGALYVDSSFEVAPPVGYDGPFNHAAFQTAIGSYCRAVLDEQRAANALAGSDFSPILRQARCEFPIGSWAATW